MHSQLDIFNFAAHLARTHAALQLPPFQRHSEPSRQGALATYPRLIALEQRVYDYIRARGWKGATDIEGAADLEMNPSTYRPRRIALVAYSLVVDSGMRRKGSGRVGAPVWKMG